MIGIIGTAILVLIGTVGWTNQLRMVDLVTGEQVIVALEDLSFPRVAPALAKRFPDVQVVDNPDFVAIATGKSGVQFEDIPLGGNPRKVHWFEREPKETTQVVTGWRVQPEVGNAE